MSVAVACFFFNVFFVVFFFVCVFFGSIGFWLWVFFGFQHSKF